MAEVEISNKVKIKKTLVSPTWFVVMNGDLTFTSRKFDSYVGGDQSYTVRLYEEDEEHIYLPLQYVIKNYPVLLNNFDVIDNRPQPTVTFQFKDDIWQGKLAEIQKKCINVILSKLGTFGGIINLATGMGKTAVALKLCSILGGPVIILLHRELLITQWVNEILKWTAVNARDIGIVRQDCFNGNKDIVLASIQTLIERRYDQSFYSRFHVLVADEVPRLSAKVFSTVIPQFNVRYRFGLSADVRRADGMEGVVLNEVGPIIYQDKTILYNANYCVLRFRKYFKEDWFIRSVKGQKKINLPALLNIICRDIDYKSQIIQLIKVLLTRGRKVVILSHRVSFCKYLYAQLQNYCRTLGKSIGIAVSGWKQDVKDCDLAISTYQMLGEGVDLKKQDSIIFATPMSSINQAVGRILRGDKEIVDIFDICFDIDIIKNLWIPKHKSMAKYRGWDIKDMNLDQFILEGKNSGLVVENAV